MSKNHDRQAQSTGDTALANAIRNAGAVPDGPADAAEQIEEMIEGQKEVLATLQADRELYGPVECASADGTVTERFGRKSCAAIALQVPIPALGLKLDVTIWGRLVNDATGTTVTFEAGMPKGIRATDENGKDRLLIHAELGAQSWPGYEKTTDAVMRKLTGQTATAGTVGARPKLVKRVIMAAATTPAA